MTTFEKKNMVQNMIDDPSLTQEQIEYYLKKSAASIMDRLYAAYSQRPEDEELPSRYEMLQVELAIRYIARRGGEGEISHSEGGVSRTWANADDSDLLCRVVPKAGLFEREPDRICHRVRDNSFCDNVGRMWDL